MHLLLSFPHCVTFNPFAYVGHRAICLLCLVYMFSTKVFASHSVTLVRRVSATRLSTCSTDQPFVVRQDTIIPISQEIKPVSVFISLQTCFFLNLCGPSPNTVETYVLQVKRLRLLRSWFGWNPE